MRFYLTLIVILLINIASFGQTKIFNVGFLIDKSNSEIDKRIDDLVQEIKAVIGEDAIIKFSNSNMLSNDFDAELALKQYRQLLNNETDIIIAFGTTNNLVLTKQKVFPKPTILFGTLSKELLDKLHFNENNRVENFTSIVTLQSYEEDLSLLKDLVAPKRVGLLMESSFLQYDKLYSKIAEFENDLNLDLELIPYTTIEDILNNLDGLDAVYLIGGYFFSRDEISQLAQVLIDKKIPSFTTTPIKDVEMGLLATNHDQSNVNQFFRRIALNVESIINENEFTEIGTLLELNRKLTINVNTANKLGIPLKYSLIVNTNIVGDATELVYDKKYTLIKVMQEAIEQNLQLKTVAQDVLISEKDTQLAKSDYLPDIFLSASGVYVDPNLAEVANGQSPELSTMGNITLNQTVFSNAASANITIQKALQQAQLENYNSEALNTVFDGADAYFKALIYKANYKIQSRNLELTKRNLEIATHNFEAGLSGKSDVLRFRSELTKNIQNLIVSVNKMNEGFYDLNKILNNPIDQKIDVEEAELVDGQFENYNYKQIGLFLDSPDLRKPFVEFLIHEAIENAPELKFLDYNLVAARRTEKLFGGGRFLPTVALQGQYNYTFNRTGAGSEFPPFLMTPPDGYYNVGLSLSVPIFNQNKQNLNQQIAAIQTDQINININDVKLTIEKNINDAVLGLINEISNIELSKAFEITAKENLELTQTSYANGAVNIVQLLDAQNNHLEAQLAVSTATYDYLLGIMLLERYLGTFFLMQTADERAEFVRRFLEFTNN
ncbi:MAG: TolC family protein [Flavobacteriaceae bacterium]|nr:TolC family protein [Flavobacteriaceae bacterium]